MRNICAEHNDDSSGEEENNYEEDLAEENEMPVAWCPNSTMEEFDSTFNFDFAMQQNSLGEMQFFAAAQCASNQSVQNTIEFNCVAMQQQQQQQMMVKVQSEPQKPKNKPVKKCVGSKPHCKALPLAVKPKISKPAAGASNKNSLAVAAKPFARAPVPAKGMKMMVQAKCQGAAASGGKSPQMVCRIMAQQNGSAQKMVAMAQIVNKNDVGTVPPKQPLKSLPASGTPKAAILKPTAVIKAQDRNCLKSPALKVRAKGEHLSAGNLKTPNLSPKVTPISPCALHRSPLNCCPYKTFK